MIKSIERKISIVIPVYNVSEYVEECLKSVFEQQNENVEIIIIDDGSTDDSYKKCKNYLEKQVCCNCKLITQENRGLSAARNIGIENASGEYIMFLDSDDMLSRYAIKKLISEINKCEQVDIYYFDAIVRDEIQDGKPRAKYSRETKVPDVVMEAEEYFRNYWLEPLTLSACLCLFKRKTILENRLCFPVGRLHEDNLFSFLAIMNAKKVKYIPEQLYVRRYRENSITTKKISEKHIEDLCAIYVLNIDYIKSHCEKGKNEMPMVYFVYRGWRYIVYKTISENVNITLLEVFLKKYVDFLCAIKQKNVTYYKILDEFNMFIEKQQLNVAKVLYDCKEVEQRYLALFDRFHFKERKKVGLYGKGQHTISLLEKYHSMQGDVNAELFFVDSEEESFRSKHLGIDVLNIRDAQQHLDYIVISSFRYRNEMKMECEKYITNNAVEVIDIYELEKMPIF